MRSLQVLVVDDEPAIRQIMAGTIEKAGHAVATAADGESALQRLTKGDIDVALCDIRMPDITGIDVVTRTRAAGIETLFLMMTAYASMETAIEAMRAGAYDYMLKPLRNEDVLNRLARLGDIISLRSENLALRKIIQSQDGKSCRMLSPAMQEIEQLVAKVAPTDSTVLITGPSGTGKGVLSRSLHRQSRRAENPFVVVNCGAIPENLLESEFFGHTKGAFTGAHKAKRGLFVQADQGTLFLDEIGELPLNLQVKLLHAIEDHTVRAVGSEQERKVNVRVITATNRDLEQMVRDGTFREDLYFRLNVFNVILPPLCERPEDVGQLIDFLLLAESDKLGKSEPPGITVEARERLCQYEWPGNVRELQNTIARAIILADNQMITPAELSQKINRATTGSGVELPRCSGTLKEQMRNFEVAVIKRTIGETAGDRKAAAIRLGVSISSLYRKLEDSDNGDNF